MSSSPWADTEISRRAQRGLLIIRRRARVAPRQRSQFREILSAMTQRSANGKRAYLTSSVAPRFTAKAEGPSR